MSANISLITLIIDNYTIKLYGVKTIIQYRIHIFKLVGVKKTNRVGRKKNFFPYKFRLRYYHTKCRLEVNLL